VLVGWLVLSLGAYVEGWKVHTRREFLRKRSLMTNTDARRSAMLWRWRNGWCNEECGVLGGVVGGAAQREDKRMAPRDNERTCSGTFEPESSPRCCCWLIGFEPRLASDR